MKTVLFFLLFFVTSTLFAGMDNIEQIIVIRHGEKPLLEIGQLNCKGLNRSLLLPHYFKTHFPKPSAIFAPNPTVQISSFFGRDHYDYIRPLATIEPTAISLDMPVNTQIGFNQPEKLMQTLLEEKYHSSVIYVAWEHENIEKLAHLLLAQFHNTSTVPNWNYFNYDKVYVFTIHWNKNPVAIDFLVTSEGLKNISSHCPS